jgi:tartrate-resistant acid phosphatase type 5
MRSFLLSQLIFSVFTLASVYVAAQLVPLQREDTIKGLQRKDGALNFIVMGDWGKRGAPGQQQVADAMGKAGSQLNISFVISTGDNFYPGGVSTVADSQWISSFENVYNASSLRVKWYPVLGNHDYILDPDAQVAYTQHSSRWHMPARYYDTSFAIGTDSVLVVFLDTDPMDRELRKLPYDSLKYPAGGVTKQLQWLEQVLSTSRAKWKMIIGHHPMHTGGAFRHNRRTRNLRKLLRPVFERHKIDVYFCGHDHHLEYLKPKKEPTHYIISGGGSSARHVGWLKFHRKFAAKKPGFVTVSLSSNELLLQVISINNKVIYHTVIGK